jgi:hypothetical protein
VGGDIVAAAGGHADVAIAVNAALAACAKWGRNSLAAGADNPCGLAAIPDSPVGTDLQYDSPAIQAMPAWPTDVPLLALAGDIEAHYPVSDLPPGGALPFPVRLPTFRQQLVPIGLGDVPVSLDSAGALGPPEEPIRCAAAFPDLFSSSCWHVALPRNPVLAGTVLTAIRAAVDAQNTPPVDWRNRAYTTDCDRALDQPLTVTLQAGTATSTASGGFDQVTVTADAVVSGDLTGDGRPETAVLLGCVPQPSNYTTQEIQVFSDDGGRLGNPLRSSDLTAGAILPPQLDTTSLTIGDGTMHVAAKTYVDGDSHASGPSASSVITWRWNGQDLRIISR